MIPTAMSGAERQRRYPDRLLKRDPSATELTLTQELEKARGRIAELEKALAAAQQNTSAMQRVSEHAQKWRKLSPHERRVMDLQTKIRQLEALVLPLDDTQKDALRQYKRKVNREFKARWRSVESYIKDQLRHAVIMQSKDYRLFRGGFHPDASKEIRDNARDRFEKLYKKIVRDADKIKRPPPFEPSAE